MLELSGVSASYGSVPAIHDVSIAIGEGEAVGLLGANGAGKSTTLARDLGPGEDDIGHRSPLPASISRRCRRTGFRSWASPMCRRDARCFPK